MRAFYTPRDDAKELQEMEFLGVGPEDYPDEWVVEDGTPARLVSIWAENYPIVRVFLDMQNQWRVGPSGVTGLDFNVWPQFMRMRGVPRTPERHQETLLMEAEALRCMHPPKAD